MEFLASGQGVDPAFLTHEVNEADNYAVEEALRLRDESGEGEVVVVTAGEDGSEEALRRCIAMGADRAVRVPLAADEAADPIHVARRLAVAARQVQPDLILCGVQSSDAAQQSTGPALASALRMPSVCVVTQVELAGDGLVAHREFEGGLAEIVEVERPAVLTVQTGLNEPRYGTFKGMMRAKKAQVEVVEDAATAPRVMVRRMYQPTLDQGRVTHVEQSSPSEVAARIIEIVQEARR
ncbi:electron transfer flavoprotein subunit beta/FixA family protein [Nocardioides sp.]|uniref:electron transfer flavoprotein subunit beta/FixA family protein n=1 Tax=Nocardioides sp. TaxID=35761 RepID=UPI002639AAB0|nr:electron transfer flavoprotein subunit beta/FixA family protein [Nocardioides sp.]